MSSVLVPIPPNDPKRSLTVCSTRKSLSHRASRRYIHHHCDMGGVNFLTAMGLFIGQAPAFFELLRDLAEDADKARRGR
jgi:hypothetical protein